MKLDQHEHKEEWCEKCDEHSIAFDTQCKCEKALNASHHKMMMSRIKKKYGNVKNMLKIIGEEIDKKQADKSLSKKGD